MDKNILRQYRSLAKEFEAEERRIKAMDLQLEKIIPEVKEMTDVVTRGKRGKKPLGICVIHGNADSSVVRRRTRIRTRKAKQELRLSEIENMLLDAEEFINSTADSEARMMMRYYYLEGMSWQQVAAAMGDGYTADACKKKVQRILDKI